MPDSPSLPDRLRLIAAWADALWRRYRRNGTIRRLPGDQYDTAPRRVSAAEAERLQEILDRRSQ